ncbi:MAG: glutamine cyclotransferase [Cellvibrionaceae bacterium]
MVAILNILPPPKKIQSALTPGATFIKPSLSVSTFLSIAVSITTAAYFIGTAADVRAKTVMPEKTIEEKVKQTAAQKPKQTIITQQANVLAVEKHNSTWFTQGLYTEGNTVYISSGLYGRSVLIKQSKAPVAAQQLQQKKEKQQRYQLNPRYFAEGLTVIGEILYLLTWKENTLLMLNKNTLKPLGKKSYQGEAWGLTHIPNTKHTSAEFIMSDGSDTLSFRDIDTFKINRQLKINNLNFINELEYVNGVIWANRWYDNHLYGINIQTGCIVAKVDLLPMRKKATTINNKNVVNGVSYDKKRKGLWVTGKYWSKRFLIEMPLTLGQKQCY